MAELSALMIRGIRSFSPDDNGQVIKFQKPLTLIVGPNGSGKTTLIECLKYATVGMMPPGGKGSIFVHDPKVANASAVRAQVKLKFSDPAGNPVVIIRSLCSQQKMNRLECRTVDGTIQRKVDGKVTSLSMKCVEVDEEMTSILGISRAVLDNVIFCHQEESNWPLSEPKVLKEKFDELFSATRYNKALDEVKKIRKNLKTSLIAGKSEMRYLTMNNEKAAQLSRELGATNSSLVSLDDETERLQSQLKPLEDQLKKINESLQVANELNMRIKHLNTKQQMHSERVFEILKNLKQPFQGDDEDLANELANFESSSEADAISFASVKRALSTIEVDVCGLRQQKDSIISAREKLLAEIDFEKKNEEKITQMLRYMAQRLDVTDIDSLDEEQRQSTVLQVCRSKIGAVNENKKEHAKLMADMQARVCEIKQKSQASSVLLTQLDRRMEAKRELLRQTRQQLDENQQAQDRLADIRERAKRVNEELEEMTNSDKQQKLKDAIGEREFQKHECSKKLAKLQEAYLNSMELDTVATELKMLQGESKKKKDDIEFRLNAHQESINTYFAGVKTIDLRMEFEKRLNKKQTEQNQLKNSVFDMDTKLRDVICQRNLLESKIYEMNKEIFLNEKKIAEAKCDQQASYETELQDVNLELEKLQFEKGTYDGMQFLYKKYLAAAQDKPCCPLCDREFAQRSEAADFVQKIDQQLENLPQNQMRLKENLQSMVERRERLLDVRPCIETLNKLRNTSLPEATKEREVLITKMSDLEKNIIEPKKRLSLLEKEVTDLIAMRDDVLIVDSLQRQVDAMEKKIGHCELQLQHSGVRETGKTLYANLEAERLRLVGITTEMEWHREKLNKYRNELQAVRDRLHRYNQEEMELTKSQRNTAVLVDQVKSMEQELSQIDDEQTMVRGEFKRYQSEGDQLTDEMEAFDRDYVAKCSDDWQLVDELKRQMQQLDSLQALVTNDRRRERSDQLTAVDDQLAIVSSEIEELEARRSREQEKCHQLNDSLSRADLRKRELEDNVRLRDEQKQAELAQKEAQSVQMQLKEMGFTEGASIDAAKLNETYCEKNKAYQRLVGKRAAVQQSVERLQDELNCEQYLDAKKKCQEKQIEITTTELVCEDLLKFSIALDTAVIRRHIMLIEQINLTVKDLWRNVYKGNDIEYIELKSEEFSIQNEKRRSYNYRLVMYRDGVELDMRGHCSAGQKVLASIIIRIALAEIFSSRCGFFALDEPTTNLDAANTESLASAIADLIHSRADEKHFQLVLITHDESFVEKIAHSWPLDVYYRVSKDDRGCSVLTEQHTRNLFR